MAVADERGLQLAVPIFIRPRKVEIENTHAVARFALIDAAVTRPDHHAIPAFLFATEINHRVRNGRVAVDRIRAGPEKEIAGLQIFQLERIVPAANHRFEFSGATQPDVLRTRITRYIADAILAKYKIHKPGAIHSAVGRIVRTVFVIEISSGQFERSAEKFLHVVGIIFESFYLFRGQRSVRRAALRSW